MKKSVECAGRKQYSGKSAVLIHWAVSIHWTGLLDWTTGLTQNGVKCLFQPFSV